MALSRTRRKLSRSVFGVVAVALLAMAGPNALAQSAGVTMKVSPVSVNEGEDITVELTFRGNYDRYTLPDLKDFKTVGQQQSSQVTISNGQVKRTLNLTLRVIPKRPGVFQVGSPKLYNNGQMVATAPPRTVRVKKEAPLDPASAANSASGALQKMAARTSAFLHPSSDQTSVYVGQPFALRWEVYVGDNYRVDNFTALTRPKLEGFLSEELPTAGPRSVTPKRRRTIGNRSFTAIRVSTQLLTPLKAGRVIVDAFGGEITYGERRSFSRRRKSIRSTPYFIEVKPLPPNPPKGFSGANIGKFRMTVSLTNAQGNKPRTIQTGQRMVLKVEVSGEGNIGGIDAPVVDDDGGRFEIQQLPSGLADEIEKTPSGVTGKRRFEYLVTALKPGAYETPTVRLAYFDPSTASYNTAVGKGSNVKVTGAVLTSGSVPASGGGPTPDGAADIGPIAEGVSLSHHGRSALPTTLLFWILVGLPLVGFAAVDVRFRRQRRDTRDPAGRRSRSAAANARKRLGAAERALKDDLVKDFYGQIARTLTHFFEERAQLPATGMTHDVLREAASSLGYPSELLDAVVTELENCDFARFAPSDTANKDMRETLGRVESLVGLLAEVKPQAAQEVA